MEQSVINNSRNNPASFLKIQLASESEEKEILTNKTILCIDPFIHDQF